MKVRKVRQNLCVTNLIEPMTFLFILQDLVTNVSLRIVHGTTSGQGSFLIECRLLVPKHEGAQTNFPENVSHSSAQKCVLL